MQKPSSGWNNQKKKSFNKPNGFKKPNHSGNDKKPVNRVQHKKVKPKEPEVKVITGDPEKLYVEAYQKLLDWVFPKKEDTQPTLIMNRLFGKNDKGFLIEEKAKTLLGVHDVEGTKLQDKLVAEASNIRSTYKIAITTTMDHRSLTCDDILLIFNSFTPLARYGLLIGTPLEAYYNDIRRIIIKVDTIRIVTNGIESSVVSKTVDANPA